MGLGVKTEGKRVACGVFEPISWSVNDTETTIVRVKKHNAAWKVTCKN